jgi:CDP-ribitol ribitolphosphotransferase
MPDGNGPRAPLGKRFSRKVLPPARRVKIANLAYRLSRLINPPRGNRILFASEGRTSIGGNLARVHERMIERGLDSRYKFCYSFRIPSTVSRWSTLHAIYLLATSDIVLVDDYFALLAGLRFSPETKIIQLWHAGSGFKSIGYSRFGKYGSRGLANAHRKYTYAITGSKHLIPVYAEAFGIEESAVVATGLPRIDTFATPRAPRRSSRTSSSSTRISMARGSFCSPRPSAGGASGTPTTTTPATISPSFMRCAAICQWLEFRQ